MINLGSIINSQTVPRYKEKMGHGWPFIEIDVQILFSTSVNWQLSGFQMGTTL